MFEETFGFLTEPKCQEFKATDCKLKREYIERN